MSEHVVEFTVPTGWTKNVVSSAAWSQSSESRVSFGNPTRIHADPCERDGDLVEIGPKVDDLVAALADVPGVETTTSDVTVSGYSGRRVDMTVPELTGCTDGEAVLDADTGGPLDAGAHAFLVLDVDGDRVTIHSTARTTAPERETTQLAAIVESIRIR